MIDPVHKPSLASLCFTRASEAGYGRSQWRRDWPAQVVQLPSMCREAGTGRAGEQAGQLPGCAQRNLCHSLHIQSWPGNSESFIWKWGSWHSRKLQIWLGCLCCPYSQWSELSCFKNLHHCKAEDNRGAHLCKMPTKDRWCCLHVPLLCPAQYWTRSDQLLLFALFCSGNKKGAGQSRTKRINSVTLRQGKILQKTLRIQVGAWVEIVQQKKSS